MKESQLKEAKKLVDEDKQKYIHVNKWKLKRAKLSVKYWKDVLLERFKPDRTVLINMELVNGMHRSFLVREKKKGFKYKGGMYIFDDDSKYFNIDAKIWSFDFHESYCLPIKRNMPISDIKKVLESANISEVEYASNPMTLERFIVSRVAEGIMKGQQLDDFMKQIRLILIITMVSAVIHLFLFMSKTGMLKAVKLPF